MALMRFGKLKAKFAMKWAKKLPQARDDSAEVAENGAVSIDVLDNDLGGRAKRLFSLDQDDPSNQTAPGDWVTLDSGARIKIEEGQVVYDTNGAFDFLAEDELTTDTFTYAIRLGNGRITTAEVTVEITGENEIAQVTGDTGSVTEDGTLVAGGTVIVGDADSGQSGTVAQTDVAGLYGTFWVDAAGVWSYMLDNDNPAVQALNDGETLMDSFEVFSTDGSASANVDVTINGADDGSNTDPTVENDRILTSANTVAVIPAAWLLQNDNDIDLDTLSVSAIDNGALGDWTVTPNFSGADLVSFTVTTSIGGAADLVLNYSVSDGNGGSAGDTVTIALAGTSSAGADIIDLSLKDYNFSYIDGMDGSDIVGGGTAETSAAWAGTIGSDLFIGGDGSDTLTGGKGDDELHGGNLDGTDSAFASNVLIGDEANIGSILPGTPVLDGSYTGGNDRLFGADEASNNLYGDAFSTVRLDAGESFAGGNDLLVGGDSNTAGVSASNTLLGDTNSVFSMGSAALTGGNDTLIGGSGTSFRDLGGFILWDVTNFLVGDANSNGNADTTFIGGNDILIGGTMAADFMTGDWGGGSGSGIGGNDTFVFASENGQDSIEDFVRGEDIINLSGTTLSFANLDSNSNGVLDDADAHVSISGSDTVIDLGKAEGGVVGLHTVTVEGVTGMDQSDFSFDPLAMV